MNSRSSVILDGAIAGSLGAAAVAIWFLIFDTSRGVPFQTPILLAGVLMHGPHGVATSSGMSLAAQYTAAHFAAFILFGVGAAILMEAAEREPALLLSLFIFLGA